MPEGDYKLKYEKLLTLLLLLKILVNKLLMPIFHLKYYTESSNAGNV